MHLSSKRDKIVWKFESGASLTYRPCESLDEDICAQEAADWFNGIIRGEALRDDFGLTEQTFPEFLEKIGTSVDDTRAYSDYLFCVSLMTRLVSKAEGWMLDKKKIGLCRKLFAHILRDPDLKAEWKKRAYSQLHKVKLAGNV